MGGARPVPEEEMQRTREALDRHGWNQTAASVDLDISRSALQNRIRHLARQGIAPGHWNSGVAYGYHMGKVTVQRNGATGEVERLWERQHPDAERLEQIFAGIEERAERVQPIPEIPIPKAFGSEQLLNQVSIFDGHLGALAWDTETGGGNWDLSIAREAMLTGTAWLLENLPRSRDVLIVIGGDYTETDGYAPLTPTSKHVLDVDSRYPRIFDTAEYVIEAAVTQALRLYRNVTLKLLPGNHDPQTIFALRRVFLRVFAENPRVTVDPCIRQYWAMLFGKTMICANHGDKVRLQDLPGIFAADFAPLWGQASYRIVHTGHWHHEKTFQQVGREFPGMLVYQHPTLANRNAWASGKGLIAARQMVGHSYHSGGALVTQLHHNPELMELAA